MTYDVFIVDGSVFKPDTNSIKLSGLSESEMMTVQRIATRQGNLDFVVRPVEIYEKSTPENRDKRIESIWWRTSRPSALALSPQMWRKSVLTALNVATT